VYELIQHGTTELHYKKYNEDMSFGKPTIKAKNIIFGGLYIDTSGSMKGYNHKTKETANVRYFEK
jgi:hypothetical protein